LTWGQVGSVRVEDGELLECARPEVSHIVDLVALEQRPDAGSQSVVAAMRTQDACSLLTAQDFHR